MSGGVCRKQEPHLGCGELIKNNYDTGVPHITIFFLNFSNLIVSLDSLSVGFLSSDCSVVRVASVVSFSEAHTRVRRRSCMRRTSLCTVRPKGKREVLWSTVLWGAVLYCVVGRSEMQWYAVTWSAALCCAVEGCGAL